MRDTRIRSIEARDLDTCGSILRSLPQWFGIDESIREYLQNLSMLDGFVAEQENEVVGFVGLKRYGVHSIEIDVIAVKPELRRNRIGHDLLDYVESNAVTPQVKFLHMKTLAPSDPDPNYAETRAFWEASGFIPMDAHDLWGPENPCQVMVKPI